MHEAHELVHTIVGRMICGCWGPRDFNVWTLCDGCYEQNNLALLSTFAGPLFSFAMIWAGLFLLNTPGDSRKQSLGFSLIFANNPFARVFTAAIGKGDEVSGLNNLLGNYQLSWILGLLIVLLFTLYPLYRSYKVIQNKNRVGYFILFLLSGIILDLVFVMGLMNKLLKNGVLSDTWILGSPIIVTSFTVLVLVIFWTTRKKIYLLAVR
jgi:hypothetical protein